MKLNLKLKEELRRIKLNDEIEIELKPYLLAEEITSIAENMLKEDNYMTREMVKGILLIHYCTNIEVKKDKSGNVIINAEEYDIYNTNGLIELIENNVNELDLIKIEEYIQYQESMSNVLKYFCKNIEDKIDKVETDLKTKGIFENLLKEVKESK